MSHSKYYKMEPGDPTSVRLEKFPSNATALKTDADGNILDAGDDAYKVKVNDEDASAGFLSDKLSDTLDVEFNPSTDNSKLESIVYQLTGKGAALASRDIQGLSHENGPGIAGFTYGRGCAPGYIYKKDLTTNTMVRQSAWLAQSSDGSIFSSVDKFVSAIKDSSLALNSIYTSEAGWGYGAQCIHYGKISIADTNYSWIVFKQSYRGFFYVPDVEASYNDDGTFKSSAWVKVANSNLSDTIAHAVSTKEGGLLLTAEYMNGVTYYTDLSSTGSVKSLGEEISGIATDSYGTYLVVARNSGKIYRNNSEVSGSFNNASWAAITNLDGFTVNGVPADNFPITGSGGGLSQTWWAGLGCAYGLWVCTVARKQATTDPVYSYSSDGVNWITYGGTADDQLITVWDMKSDGAFWFGCPVGTSTPLVYQLLVNSIPSRKRFIAEKGLVVVGDTFLQDIPNAKIVGTDGNGKIVERDLDQEVTDIVENLLSDENDVIFEPDAGVLKNTVYQLTGVGAKLVPTATDFDWQFDPTHVNPNNWGGRGISPGRVYINGLETTVWGVQETSGYLRFSSDFWKTSYLDSSLVTYIGGAQPNTIQTPSLHFVHLGGSYNCDAWVCGIYPSGSGVYFAPHTPANYNVDGTLKSTAWGVITAGRLVADMASFGGTTCLNGNHGYLMRTTDWSTFTNVLSVSGVIRGVATDRKGKWIAVRRDQSDIYYSSDDGLTWSHPQIYVNDVAVSSLYVAIGSTFSITAGNGIFLVLGLYGYAYSNDGLRWYSFPTSLSFACVGFDGVRFFATNASTLATNNTPKIWQLLVDQIAALRHIVAEDGMTVDKELYLPQLPSVNILGTDEIGRVVSKTVDLTSHGKYMPTMDPASAVSVMIPGLVGTRNEICVVMIPRIDMKVNASTVFTCAITQGGTGTIILTLRDSNYNMIATSDPITDPSGNALLSADLNELENPLTHTPITEYELVSGRVYYLGINYSVNGAAYLGVVANQNMNVTPISSKKFDNLTSAPDTLSGGSETLLRPYIAITSE